MVTGRLRGRLGLLVVALFPLAAAAPASRPDLAALLAMPVASELAADPAGGRLLWVVNRAGVRNLWAADGGAPGHPLTRYTDDDGQEIYGATLAPRGGQIAYVRGGDPEYPNGALPNPASAADPPRQLVHLAAADGSGDHVVGEGHEPVFAPDGSRLAFAAGGALMLAAGDGPVRRIAAVRGTIGQLSWFPDGSALLFAVNRGDHTLLAAADVASGAIRFLDPGFGEVGDPVFSPDGRSLAYIRAVWPPVDAAADEGSYWSIRVVDLSTGLGRTAWAAPAGAGGRYAATHGRNLFWSADGQLVFPWERTGWLHLYAVPATGGAARALTSGAFEVESFAFDPQRGAIVYEANAADLDRHGLWTVPLAGGRSQRIGDGGADLQRPVIAGDGRVAAIATDATHPARPVLVSGGERRLLFGGADDYRAAAGFAAPDAVTFAAADGGIVHGQLFRPRDGKAGKHPALVFVHGGPRRQMLLGFSAMGYYSNAYLMNQHLADEGYVVLSVNYRSGTGYGAAFREAPARGAGGAAEYADVLAAGRWLAARADVDPQRIGLWGGSWGGYLTALGLARDSRLFAAGVDFHGDVNLTKPDDVDVNGLSPDAAAEALRTAWRASPAAAMSGWRSPVLVIHGDDDRNVLFAQSVMLVRWLQQHGVEHEELVLPDERHAFFRYASWLAAYRAADDFLTRKLH